MSEGWIGTAANHIYPRNDLRQHVLKGTECWCRPTVTDEEEGRLVVHHSMDRREDYEHQQVH